MGTEKIELSPNANREAGQLNTYLYSIPKSYVNYVTKPIDSGFMYVIPCEMAT